MATSTRAERRQVLAALPLVTRYLNIGAGLLFVALIVVWLAVNFYKTPALWTADLIQGTRDGAIYALIALGYTLVYGIIELINFAHGDVFMWGSMVAFTVGVQWIGLNGSQNAFITVLLLIVVLVIAMAFCGVLNVVIERFAYRPLRNAPRLAPLITAIGVSFILQNLAAAFYSFNSRNLGDIQILPRSTMFHVGVYSVQWKSLIVVLVVLPVLGVLTWLVRSTKSGKAMRATAQDMEAARMLGIDVNRTIAFTFAVGGALAGAAGLLYLLTFTYTRYDLGFKLGLFAFTAAVLGGIGNLSGATLGAFLIGLIQNFNEGLTWHAPGSDWTESIVFALLIVILVFRPQGLLGEQASDRA